MSEIIPQSRYQSEMFSSLDDQVDEHSIARIIDKIVDKLYESKEPVNRDPEPGRPEYPRSSLLKLFLYGYLHRVKSSRALERECKVNIEVIWLMQRMIPDHWTISNYRKDNQEQIKQSIISFNKFLLESGYAEGKSIVIDGTKLKANASMRGSMNTEELRERIEQTEGKITYYLEVFNNVDEYETEIELLRKEKQELENKLEYLKDSKKKVYIEADPDCNIVRVDGAKRAGYNVQISCDQKNKLILATDVVSNTNDFEQLESMYETTREMLSGKKSEEVSADAGYYSPEQIQNLEQEQQVDTYIAPLPEKVKGDFRYDREKDQYTCQMGKVLTFTQIKRVNSRRVRRYYKCAECQGCPIREECTRSKTGREKIRYHNQDFRDYYRQKMMLKESKEKIKLRKTIVEHPFGIIKMWLGKNPILCRGKTKVHTEIRLVSLAYNILRIFNIDGYERLNQVIDNYQREMA